MHSYTDTQTNQKPQNNNNNNDFFTFMPDREKWLFDCALGATHKTTAETNEEKPNTNWMSAELMMYCI